MQVSQNQESKKVFVGGLLPQTQQRSLFMYFNEVIKIDSLELKVRTKDPSVCVGFAVISCSPEAFKVLTDKGFFRYQDRDVHCIPFLKGSKLQKHMEGLNSRRVAIWGIPRTTPDSVIHDYFSKYGAIQNAIVLFKPSEDKPDAFVVFESEESSKEVFKCKNHMIQGSSVRLTQYSFVKNNSKKSEEKEPKIKSKRANRKRKRKPKKIKIADDLWEGLNNRQQSQFDPSIPNHMIIRDLSTTNKKVQYKKIGKVFTFKVQHPLRNGLPKQKTSEGYWPNSDTISDKNTPNENQGEQSGSTGNQQTWPPNYSPPKLWWPILDKNCHRVRGSWKNSRQDLKPTQKKYHSNIDTAPLLCHSSFNLSLRFENISPVTRRDLINSELNRPETKAYQGYNRYRR